MLDLPLGTVKSRSSRARVELAQAVVDLSGGPGGPARRRCHERTGGTETQGLRAGRLVPDVGPRLRTGPRTAARPDRRRLASSGPPARAGSTWSTAAAAARWPWTLNRLGREPACPGRAGPRRGLHRAPCWPAPPAQRRRPAPPHAAVAGGGAAGLMDRLGRWWQRPDPAPGFALQVAYVATVMLVLLTATPVSPLRGAPRKALSRGQAGPRGLPVVGAGLTWLTERADRRAWACATGWTGAGTARRLAGSPRRSARRPAAWTLRPARRRGRTISRRPPRRRRRESCSTP